MFADDSNIFINHKCIDNLETVANEELNKVSEWMKVNKLSLNLKKAKSILFGLREYNLNNFCLAINNSEIAIVNHT